MLFDKFNQSLWKDNINTIVTSGAASTCVLPQSACLKATVNEQSCLVLLD